MHYAGLWCAREAAFKALSPFVQLDLRHLHVAHDPRGRPMITIDDPAHEALADRLRVEHQPLGHDGDRLFVVLDLRPEG